MTGSEEGEGTPPTFPSNPALSTAAVLGRHSPLGGTQRQEGREAGEQGEWTERRKEPVGIFFFLFLKLQQVFKHDGPSERA